jgi:two-component system chemotaxis response regulator CheY
MIQILIVDDSGFSRLLINKEIMEMGIENCLIQQSGSGADAFRKIKSQPFDLFILDIVMEGIDGIDVLKEVRKNQPTAKVIMCSGTHSDEIIKELIELGIDEFIVKPYKSEVFKKAVCRTLGIQMECCNETVDELKVKCHICDSKMIELSLTNTVSFFCPRNCMTIGPLVYALANQEELTRDYEIAMKNRNIDKV